MYNIVNMDNYSNTKKADDRPERFLSNTQSEIVQIIGRLRFKVWSFDKWDDYQEHVRENVVTFRHLHPNTEDFLEVIDLSDYPDDIDRDVVQEYKDWRYQNEDSTALNEEDYVFTFEDYIQWFH